MSGDADGVDPGIVELATKLFGLARGGQTEALAAYIDAGVPANLSNESGDTLLMLAAYHGHAATVAALLQRGADPNRVNDRGQTPIAGAVFKGEPEVVRALLAGGADPAAGYPSAVDSARMFGKQEMLEWFGAPRTAPGRPGPLFRAAPGRPEPASSPASGGGSPARTPEIGGTSAGPRPPGAVP